MAVDDGDPGDQPELTLVPGAPDDAEPAPSEVERMLEVMAPGTAALREAFAADFPAMRRAFSGPPPQVRRRP